jgi:HlyD family secretion protein
MPKLSIHRIFLAVCLVTALSLVSCAQTEPEWFQGYVEAEFIHVAPPSGGRLDRLNVRRGETVAQGAPLFALDSEREAAALREAESDLAQARNRLADLERGQRPTELEAIRARLAQARTALELSGKELDRRQELFDQDLIPREQLDQARSNFEQSRDRVRQIEAELETARLGGREYALEAARAQVEAAQARVAQAEWALEQRTGDAPEAGLVFDTIFEVGEHVPAARPVVSLLPPDRIILRFFVPEPMAGSLRPGDEVLVDYDGLQAPLPATVTFVSPQVEYTPPVIFSRESRTKLVFMVEARPRAEDARRFRPGQPISVRPGAARG